MGLLKMDAECTQEWMMGLVCLWCSLGTTIQLFISSPSTSLCWQVMEPSTHVFFFLFLTSPWPFLSLFYHWNLFFADSELSSVESITVGDFLSNGRDQLLLVHNREKFSYTLTDLHTTYPSKTKLQICECLHPLLLVCNVATNIIYVCSE